MKFARGLAVASLVSASLPLAVACGSASNDLFSASGGALGAAGSGAGMSAGGTESEGGRANAGTAGTIVGSAGSASGADAGGESSGGSAGSATAGMSGNGEGGALTAGSGGSAAGSAGAAAGSGGSSAGSGGSAGTAGAGTAGTGGGSAGSGGGSAGNAGCPASAPKDGVNCSEHTPDSCFYVGSACSCLPTGGGGGPANKKWACYGTPANCPDVKPTALSCKANFGAECPYPGGDFCACVGFGNEAHWACQPANPSCPSPNKPAENMSCSAGGVRTCSYDDVACFCNGSDWGCEGG